MRWAKLIVLIEPMYPKGEGAGRAPVGLERMLRIHFLQHWFNFSDPSVEEALYDSKAMREFVGIDLGREPAPDETTIRRRALRVGRLGLSGAGRYHPHPRTERARPHASALSSR